jgi:hypothetical protein
LTHCTTAIAPGRVLQRITYRVILQRIVVKMQLCQLGQRLDLLGNGLDRIEASVKRREQARGWRPTRNVYVHVQTQ